MPNAVDLELLHTIRAKTRQRYPRLYGAPCISQILNQVKTKRQTYFPQTFSVNLLLLFAVRRESFAASKFLLFIIINISLFFLL